jgi:hypothetical protein
MAVRSGADERRACATPALTCALCQQAPAGAPIWQVPWAEHYFFHCARLENVRNALLEPILLLGTTHETKRAE